MSSKVLSLYALDIGKDYIQRTLKPPVAKCIKANLSLEIDPQRLQGTSENVDTNLKSLLDTTQSFLDNIIESVDMCPT